MSRRYERITLTDLSPTVGSEVTDIDLTDIDEETFADLTAAFIDRGVLFFRNQSFTAQQQIDFAARFTPPETYPFKTGNTAFKPHPENLDLIVRLEHDADRPGYENLWHTDVSWMQEPSMGSVLYAIDVPETGGDTLFSDCQAVYEDLSPDMQALISDHTVRHDWMHTFGRNMDPETLAHFRAIYPSAEHPLVRTQPDTGRKALYLGRAFAVGITGMDKARSDLLMGHLQDLVARPEYQCRWHWEIGSVALWDNRRVQHYAVNDYYPQRRVMDRVTMAGDKPY